MQVPRRLESEVILYWHGSCQGNASLWLQLQGPRAERVGCFHRSIRIYASLRGQDDICVRKCVDGCL